MVKANVFLHHLSVDLNYRFFTGIPFEEAVDLYRYMDPDIMHYIPAAHEEIAVKLAAGAWTSGFKSIIMLDVGKVEKVDLSFNIDYCIPTLFISNGKPKISGFYVFKDIDKLPAEVEKGRKPGVLVLG